MKLRFRKNSLRLRLNQLEVNALAAGEPIIENVEFPGDARLSYTLTRSPQAEPAATFTKGIISVIVPADSIRQWSTGEDIGMYFELPANGSSLHVAIEKDLECVDGPPEEQDPHAFPRANASC